MNNGSQANGRQNLSNTYRWVVVACGAAAVTFAAARMPLPKLDLRFMLLVVVTMIVSSRFAVKVPRANTNVTVSDTFIFLALLVYGGFAGIFIAAAEGLFSGIRISKKPLVVAFNSAMMACSTFLTVAIVQFFLAQLQISDFTNGSSLSRRSARWRWRSISSTRESAPAGSR